jgi:hypothetical protein
MAIAGLRLLEERAQEAILASCRDVLRASGFRFEDAWAKVIPGTACPLSFSATSGKSLYFSCKMLGR